MNIAILIEKIGEGGGAEKVAFYTVENLLKKGVNVTVYCNRGNVPEGAEIVYVPILKLGSFFKAASFSLFSYLLCKKKNTIIMSFGGTFYQHILRAGDGVHKEWLWRRSGGSLKKFIRYCINPFHLFMMILQRVQFNKYFTKLIISPSFFVKEQIIRHYNYPSHKIVVLPTAVEQIDKPFFEKEKRFTILFVGSGFERKGLIHLLKAISLMNEEELILWIIGRDKKEERYKKLCRQLNIEEKVEFLGFQKDTKDYYKKAHVLCLPSIYDPFPNVVLEAMSVGVVPIVSKACGVSEIIEDGIDGFVIETNPQDIAEKIKLLYKRRDLLERMSLSTRQKVNQYSWNNYTERLLEIIDSLKI